jgi:NADH:ubiquinone oxidoreductase subunit K
MVRYAIRREATTRAASDKVGKGLALASSIYRHFKTANVVKVEDMKG